MTKSEIIEKLKALSSSDQRPASARMRDYIDWIETALANGVRRADIVASLNEGGIPITLKNFEQTLYRERRKKAEEAHQEKQNYLGTGAVNPKTNEAKSTAPAPQAQPVKPTGSTAQSVSSQIRDAGRNPLADDE